LGTPGLLNHITGTLEEIEILKDENNSLMKTIRMPRHMGDITERLPGQQYDSHPKIKRTNSHSSPKLEKITEEVKVNSKVPNFVHV
jgi:hypothetical protein